MALYEIEYMGEKPSPKVTDALVIARSAKSALARLDHLIPEGDRLNYRVRPVDTVTPRVLVVRDEW
jgi:hypothetical protein